MKRIAPVTKNEIIELEIQSLGHEGQGIGKYDNFTIFVPEVLPGERVEVKIIKIEKSYAIGKLLTIIDESSERQTPACEIAKRCGGCQIQHMNYALQLAFKRQIVIDNLQRIGKLENIVVHPTIGMEDPWNYRNKAQVPVGSTEDQKLISGFYASRSHDIIPLESCAIQHGQNDELITKVRYIAERQGLTAYNEQNHQGLLRHIVVRTGFKTSEVMVVLVVNGQKLPNQDAIAKEISELSENIKSVCININTKKTNVIFGDTTKVLFGSDKIFDYIGDIKFGISARSFYQVNPTQTEVLYGKALEYADLTGKETVIDAYCGIGTITLFLANKARKVYGVEIVPEAIEDANYNAKLNGIDNVEFVVAKAEEWIPKLYQRLAKQNVGKSNSQQGDTSSNLPEVIVVDPPRKGCDQALLDTIIAMKPERVVYVSCNPSTLARDLRLLADGGFIVKEVQPVDMFPHTSHVEVVVKLEKVDIL